MPDTVKPKTRTRKVGPDTKKTAEGSKSPLPKELESQIKDIRNGLEYEIVGRDTYITISGKRLTLTKWGLKKSLAYGGKVVQIAQRAASLIPRNSDGEVGDVDIGFLAQIVSIIAEDVLDIIAGSLSSPFTSHAEAVEWLDQNADIEQLFALGYSIYEQNLLENNGLGKLTKSLESLGKRLNKATQ